MSDVQHLTHTKRHGTASPHERPAVRRRDGMAAQSLRRIAAVGDAVSFSRRPFFPPPKPSADCRHRADGEDGEAAGPKPGLFPQPKLFVDFRHRADGEGELTLPHIWGLSGIELCQPIADGLTFCISVPFLLPFLKELKEQGDEE